MDHGYECIECFEQYSENTETGYCLICEGRLVEVSRLSYDNDEYDY